MPQIVESWLVIAAALGYLVSSALYGAHLLLRQPPLARRARVAAIVAVALHTVAIGVHCAATRQTPFISPTETLSASVWAIALITVLLESAAKRGGAGAGAPTAVAALAMPASFLCLFVGRVLHAAAPGRDGSDSPLLDSGLISLHVVAILFAFGLLVVAFGCAALYLTQYRMLKRKQVRGGLFGKLPPLTNLETLGFSLVAFAFPLLTLGLIAGVIRAASQGGWHGPWMADGKVLTSLATWLVYLIYLAGHVLAHWRGPRANYLLVGGLMAALLTFFAPSSVHTF